MTKILQEVKNRLSRILDDDTLPVGAWREMSALYIAVQMELEDEQQTQVSTTAKPKQKKGRKKKETASVTQASQPEVITISCDASIKSNPGGPAAIGFVVNIPGKDPVKVGKSTPSLTNNEAEYDAVYEGLLFVANTLFRPKWPILIHSDSQLVVKQLNGQYKISDDKPQLKKKCQLIHELVSTMGAAAVIEWKPRNSTPELEEANFLAQDVLGVKRH